jgi:acid phosphatase family membrane protein YuiD
MNNIQEVLILNILDIFQNDILMASLLAWFVAQVVKIIINAIVNKTFAIERLFGDGGMPSGHSATVTAAAFMIGLTEGFTSPLFGLSLVFAIIVMHDATGVRREAGKHAESIMEIINILNNYFDYLNENDIELRHKKLKILIGHTHLQDFFGAITGLCVAVIYTLLRHPSLLGV